MTQRDFHDLVAMSDPNGGSPGIEQSQAEQGKPRSQRDSNATRFLNGQCVVSVLSGSMINPGFDLVQCRSHLELNGFQIPESDLEDPLKTALDVPSVKRYMTFNSSMFHFLLAPVLYLVLWCALFSSLRSYLTISDYWVLCLCVSLVSIILTTSIIFTLHHSNKQMNINLDVRLIAVNERLVKHKLLVAVADWVENCSNNLQLYFVYWDMARCLKALTETLEERNYEAQHIQKRLQKRMSHLVLVGDSPRSPSRTQPEADVEGGQEEHRPLLQNEEPEQTSSSDLKRAQQLTSKYSLVPDPALPPQARAQQLLMSYSALYTKLLVSERLSAPSHLRRRNHCTTASLCLCQYIHTNVLR